MRTEEAAERAAEVVDRLWRAYAPFQRGRNALGDLTSMLAILVLAQFAESVGAEDDSVVPLWKRAAREAARGFSPLIDLRAAMERADSHPAFPLRDLPGRSFSDLGFGDASEDVPWLTAYLSALVPFPPLSPDTATPWAEVSDLLIERHLQEGALSAGEYFTPREVVRLMVEALAPQPGDRILDPACGSGGFLATATQYVAEAGGVRGPSIEAYATDHGNLRLATMNLALHGVDRPVVRASDPVSLVRSRSGGLADYVLTNPPFNQRLESTSSHAWPFGQPPEANANFAWLQLAWSRLSEGGIATVLMPPRAAWSENGGEDEIRRRMVASGAVLGVIALPPNLFAETAVPVHVWILVRDRSRHLPEGDGDALLFVNASRLGRQVPRQPRVLTEAEAQRISGLIAEWRRSPRTTADEPGFSRTVRLEEVADNDFRLDPRLYVESDPLLPSPGADLAVLVAGIGDHVEALSRSGTEIHHSFDLCRRLAGGAVRRAPLRSVVEGPPRDGRRESPLSRPGFLLAGPSGSLIRAEHYVDSDGVPVVMPKDLAGVGISADSIRRIPEERAASLDRFRLQPGDIVLARRGELGRCSVVRDEERGWLCGTGCFLLRPARDVDPDYLAAFLRSPEARKWLDSRSTGSMTMKTISLDVLADLPVALPDPEVQRLVVRLLSSADEHERLLREGLVTTQRIRDDALRGFFSGQS